MQHRTLASSPLPDKPMATDSQLPILSQLVTCSTVTLDYVKTFIHSQIMS